MRLILLVLLFLIWGMWTPDAARLVFVPRAMGMSLFVSGYCLLIIGMRWWGNRLARGVIGSELGTAVDRFNRGMNVSRFLIPIWFGVGVFLLGWRLIVDELLEPVARFPVMTPGVVAGLIPGLFAWMGLWWSQYPVDCVLREHNALHLVEAELPVFAPAKFRSYFVNKLRVQLLFTTVPVLLILCLRDVLMLALTAAAQTSLGQSMGLRLPFSSALESFASFGPAVVVMLLSPVLLRHILHTQRLPESRLRRDLTAIAAKAGIACREILLWRTQNNLGNAAVMGLIPRVRFVLLSDLLLESMTDLQIQAVFAHELGHVKHRHLAWFVAFFLTASSCLFALTGAAGDSLHLHENGRQAYDLLAALACTVAMIVAYGFISRWFERQADVFAARTIQRWADFSEEIPKLPQPMPAELGAQVFAAALYRVAVVNNIPVDARNWTHGSIDSRIRYIRRFGQDLDVVAEFDRKSRRMLIVLAMVIGGCGTVAAIAEVRGW